MKENFKFLDEFLGRMLTILLEALFTMFIDTNDIDDVKQFFKEKDSKFDAAIAEGKFQVENIYEKN